MAERVVRRHCSIILKDFPIESSPGLSKNIKNRLSSAEVHDIKQRLYVDEDAENEQVQIDEAAWAEEVLRRRSHELADEEEDKAIMLLKPTLKPINAIEELEDSDPESFKEMFIKKKN
mmetsp:Transcript_11399/g.14352  ORF Transcript_11399/g.14352 Transcript_11399/m.14352 type:complete len:118 (+) Transcript_11399:112-465(+)